MAQCNHKQTEDDMKLEAALWLEGAYYIDRSHAGELRVVGPNNHLYYGSTGLEHNQIQVLEVTSQGNEVQLGLELTPAEGFLPDPAMGHIRRVRERTQRDHHPDRTFAEIERLHPGELRPNQTTVNLESRTPSVTYL